MALDSLISIGRKIFQIGTILLVSILDTQAGTEEDTLSLTDSTPKYTMIITPRINTAGHFPFTGSLINHNLNADLNIFYSRKTLGFFIFKSYDITDPHSIVNYFQPGVFANLPVRENLKLRAVFGYLFSQTTEFRDADSDYYAALAVYWNLTDRLRIEHTALFYDYNIDKKLANRFLTSWSSEKIRIDLYLWHRMVIDEQNHALSSSLALTFPIIKLNEKILLQLTSSYMGYLTKAKPDYALRDGFLFTLSAQVSGH